MTEFLSRAIESIQRQLQPRPFNGVVIERDAVVLTASEAMALVEAVTTQAKHEEPK